MIDTDGHENASVERNIKLCKTISRTKESPRKGVLVHGEQPGSNVCRESRKNRWYAGNECCFQ